MKANGKKSIQKDERQRDGVRRRESVKAGQAHESTHA